MQNQPDIVKQLKDVQALQGQGGKVQEANIEMYIREDGRYVVREYFSAKPPTLPTIGNCQFVKECSLKLFSVVHDIPIDNPILSKKEVQEIGKLPLYI